MPTRVTKAPHIVNGVEHLVYTLRVGDASADVWPTGLNLARWSVGDRSIVYAPTPQELADRPTRGGIPILFPFPNRIQDGRFSAHGRTFDLARNDSTQRNAIHGYTPRGVWHTPETENDATSATLRSTFDSQAVEDGRANWPDEYRLTVNIRLQASSLTYLAQVENIGTTPLPFGLGYHPYFSVTPESQIVTPARGRWELVDSLPTGTVLPLDAAYDLTRPRPVATLTLDDVYTDLPPAGALREVGRLVHPDGTLSIRADPAFRELVLFTPPHRHAVAVEPYTCTTDAANLTTRGLDVGWIELAVGGSWSGTVEYHWIA